MSEPRKINTNGSTSAASRRSIHTEAARGYADPRLEEARARARAAAEAARLRRSQQFPRVVQQPVQPARPAAQPAASPAQAAPRPAQPAQAARPAGGTQVRHLDLNRTQGAKPAYDINNDAEFVERQRRRAVQAAQAARTAQRPAGANTVPYKAAQALQAGAPRQIHRADSAAQRTPPAQAAQGAARPAAPNAARGGVRMEAGRPDRGAAAGGKPPKGPAKGRKGGTGDGGNGKGKKGKKGKKKGLWWKILLGTLLAIALIFGGTVAIIMNAIRPEGSNLTISQLLNTPKGMEGEQLNILVLGIDRSSEGGDMAAGSVSDSQSNDGNTDMIMYVQLDFVNNEVRMLQLPRNIMVSTDNSVARNYQINNVALTQGSDGNNNYDALCTLIHEQFGLYIDGVVAIRLEALVQLVDTLGPIQVYVPEEITYTDKYGNVTSHLDQGLQWMDGATAEFFLRARKTYGQSDIQRLNVQRYFYSAMFARLRDMTVWDIAKILPVVMNYMETNLPVSDLVSAAVSLLSVSSDHIMLCQVPVYMGQLYYPTNVEHPNDVVVVARQETADLLNTYFRTPETQMTAEELNVCDNAIDLSGRSPTDPNVQYMGSLNEEVVTAAGESGTEIDPNASYDLPAPSPSPAPAESGSAGADSAAGGDASADNAA